MDTGRFSNRTETITAIVFLSFLVRPMQGEMRKFAKGVFPSARWLTYPRLTMGMKSGGGHAERYTGGQRKTSCLF